MKTLTLKLTDEEHRNLKVLSAMKGLSIKAFLMELVKKEFENTGWTNLMNAVKSSEEDTDEIDIKVIERAKIEMNMRNENSK